MNSRTGLSRGYLCLFESLNDLKVARGLFDRAAEFVASRGVADLRMLAEPGLIQMARVGSRTVGFAAALPNYNKVLIRMNGRIFPTGWLTFLLWRRKVEAIRVYRKALPSRC